MDQFPVTCIDTPEEFADYVMDELGRWAAENCPIAFRPRKFRVGLFDFLNDERSLSSGVQIKFTKDGYVIIKVIRPKIDLRDNYIVRFNIADPKLHNNMLMCFERLNKQDYSDFVTIYKAQKQWKKLM